METHPKTYGKASKRESVSERSQTDRMSYAIREEESAFTHGDSRLI